MSALSRRNLVKVAAGIAAAAAAPRVVFAQGARRGTRCAPAATGPFTVPPLSYPFNAFEPHIDAKTMEIHP